MGAILFAVVLEKAAAFADWSCGDLHVHSAPSFDSDVPVDQRLVSAVAEGLDVLVPADHDVVGDWQPNDGLLRGADLLVIPGLEITPDTWDMPVEGAHLNVFPLPSDRHPSDFRIASDSIESLIDHARSLTGTSLLQLNHPRFAPWNGLFTTLGLMPASLDPALVDQLPFDAIEVYNGHELDANVQGDVSDIMQDWFALLNVGWPAVATGSSDTHRLSGSPVGLPRTCVASTAGDPESFVDTLRAGHAFVTNGPALDVTVDGVAPGGLVQPGEPNVQVDVQVDA
ncbi:MAG: CehA/McbA family metallohydrolase, partial [Myxococcota bacterium]